MSKKKVHYAVVGLGHIAQVAILPAFENASGNSELTALVSGNEEKLRQLGKMYGAHRHTYDDYDALLASGEIDAVYITLPNSMHRDYAIRAAKAGVHVLCEKPMAMTTRDCRAMIDAAEKNDVRLMIAYRLHFEEANMKAVQITSSGKIGAPRLFSSVFTMNVKAGDIRLDKGLGGGPLHDIGIYCINAARYLFRDEPTAVTAMAASSNEKRFSQVPEMVSAILSFPEDRLASFTVSFGSADTGSYKVVGTRGELLAEPGYGYVAELKHRLTVNGKTSEETFEKRDQFAPQLISFSRHVLAGTEPESSGLEGLIDVSIIEALHKSIANGGRPVKLNLPEKTRRPDLRQAIKCPPVEKPETVNVSSPKKG